MATRVSMKLGERTPASENVRRVRLLGGEVRRLDQRRRVLRLKVATLRQVVMATGHAGLWTALQAAKRELAAVKAARDQATDLMLTAWEKRQRAVIGPRPRRRTEEAGEPEIEQNQEVA